MDDSEIECLVILAVGMGAFLAGYLSGYVHGRWKQRGERG